MNRKRWGKHPIPPKQNDFDRMIDDFDLNGGMIDSINNRIYFYSDVKRESILSLNKEIVNIDNSLSAQTLEWSCSPSMVPIYLHINSDGGSVFDGFAAVDYIRNTKCPTVSVIDGRAASAATLMSVVADKRQINKNACMLIHQLSSWFGGKYEEILDDMENNKMLMEKIKNIYIEHTRIPSNKLKSILKRDLWFDAETCLEYGLVDEILD